MNTKEIKERVARLKLAQVNEAYPRKQMEYYQEEIQIILNKKVKKNEP
jgi:hypothetical protein